MVTQRNDDAVAQCAACGRALTELAHKNYGRYKDFCSPECRNAGRVLCKMCPTPLEQSRPPYLKDFCSKKCSLRYRRIGLVSPKFIEEHYSRKFCIVCNEPIEQPMVGRKKKYCSEQCAQIYNRTGHTHQSLTEDWGVYEPEMQKALREVQIHMGTGAAMRIATAISREYVPKKDKQKTNHPGNKKLRWEQVDEIRNLHEGGNIMQSTLAEKYGVSQGCIESIVHYRNWKPEHDLRKKINQ